jgi:tripartite-type tricarboxylate transporter receptor subunit TctC
MTLRTAMSLHRRSLLAAPLLLPGAARAQAPRFPERPIEIMVGFVAGGGTDLDARSYGRALEKRLGGTVVINNRPGAGGELALAATARAKPDGHTLGTTNYPGMITIPIERKAQFTLDDFAPIANLVSDPSALTVRADSPWRRLEELIAAARKDPEKITYASPGVGSDDHLQLVLLEAVTGIKMTHVVFQGDPQLRTALLGGQVDCMGLNLGAVLQNPEKFRILSQAGASRSRFAQDIPTLRELGLPVEMASQRGVVAPAGLPPAILAQLREATAEIARDPEFVRQVEDRFTEPAFEAGEAWFARLRRERETYLDIWQKTPWAQR